MASDPTALRNRLIVAAGIWRESTTQALPRLEPGNPAKQIEDFELKLVEMLCRDATPQTAREIAEKTWDLVHQRPDSDPVKQLVMERHEALARLAHSDHW
ncbi:MAG: hypothetical protein ACR2HD_02335 [Solirubrobacteraceae bacterium]|nr:MAG: hypothetical protein DLM63_03995 [Solirubrobacterales bacterium]